MRQPRLFALLFAAALASQPPAAALAQRRSGAAARAAAAAGLPTAALAAAEKITAADLRALLNFVASDEMEGRDTPSRGLDLTAKFIAMNLSMWGVRPAGDDGTYFQRMALRRTAVDPSRTSLEFAGRRFAYGADFYDNAPVAGAVADAPLVYAGHGWVVRSKNIDPYAGLDVRGKVVVVSAGGSPPKEVTQADLKGKAGEDWLHPYLYAVRNGARAVVAMPTVRTLVRWERDRDRPGETGALSVEGLQAPEEAESSLALYEGPSGEFGLPANGRSGVPFVTASVALLDRLFQGERRSAAAILQQAAAGERVESFDLAPGKRLSLSTGYRTERVFTQNVVGLIEGSDPALRNEYVAVGAHYDHVGVAGGAAGGDRVYNGADDDGSGTVAVLELAHAFATGRRPRRSILLVWHAGEEKGLWGSDYFTRFPTVPLDRVVAQLNIDMIGRSRRADDRDPRNAQLSGPHEIYVIGSKKMSTQLGALSERVNDAYLKLAFNYKYDDPEDPEQFFYRSDHYNYARRGVPIIFYFNGPHEDYHQPGDSPDKIDYARMEKVARTIFLTAWELAAAPERPRVDRPLPQGP